MATGAVNPGTSNTVVAQQNPSNVKSVADKDTLASNFTQFLTLLTTQLKNQNPLDPLDTNQFTQQLVQFAQVEQQLKSNDQLSTLVALQETAHQSQALGYVGHTVTVDGQTAKLTAEDSATWSFNMTKPATATFNVTNSTGQTVYTGTYTVQAGQQEFIWDGRGNNGNAWPPGSYKLAITAKDASNQPVAVATEVQGVVDWVDLTKNPPVLSIRGQEFTIDKVKRVTRPVAPPPEEDPPATS
jgi:flagellar basal-body rod modification protein FlgD